MTAVYILMTLIGCGFVGASCRSGWTDRACMMLGVFLIIVGSTLFQGSLP